MPLDRRTFLAGSVSALATTALTTSAPAAEPAPVATPIRRNRIGVSTYSFWRFKEDSKLSIEDCIRHAAAMGFDAVEVLHRQMTSPDDNGYVQRLKQIALHEGVDLCGFSIHQGFVSPDPAVRQKNIDHTIHCIELAYKLGSPTLRLNTGRWNTIRDFNELMRKRGVEPKLDGYTEDQGFAWVIDSIQKCLKKAEECG